MHNGKRRFEKRMTFNGVEGRYLITKIRDGFRTDDRFDFISEWNTMRGEHYGEGNQNFMKEIVE